MASNVLPPDLVERRSDEREVFRLINALKRIIADITSSSGGAVTINLITNGDVDIFDDPGAMPPFLPATPGAPGATGATGATGAQGIAGADGLDGDDGIAGLPGREGAKGRDALNLIGLDGDDGLDGLPGLPGQRGADGNRGNPGADGNDGDDDRGFLPLQEISGIPLGALPSEYTTTGDVATTLNGDSRIRANYSRVLVGDLLINDPAELVIEDDGELLVL